MGHEHERLFILQQEILEPEDGADIQVVGGLVQEQEVRIVHQGPGQKNPPLHPRRQKPELGILIQSSPCDHRFHSLVIMPGAGCLYLVLDPFELSQQAVIAAPGDLQGKVVVFSEQFQMLPAAGGHDVIDRSRQVVGDILGQHGDPDLAALNDLACVRNDLAGQQLHQGRFARAVPAQQADPFAGLDLERDAVQQPWSAEAYGNIIDPYQSHVFLLVNRRFGRKS